MCGGCGCVCERKRVGMTECVYVFVRKLCNTYQIT